MNLNMTDGSPVGWIRKAESPLQWYNLCVLQDLELNDIVRLRKPHPCGGYEWRVVRLGADIGIVCLTCGHRVLLERRVLKHRIKRIYHQDEEAQPGTS
jgi:hypothetical protein